MVDAEPTTHWWFWKTDDGSSWAPFDDSDSAELERALSRGENNAVLGRGGATYLSTWF